MCIWRASPHNGGLELAHQYDWAQIASIFPFLACPSIPNAPSCRHRNWKQFLSLSPQPPPHRISHARWGLTPRMRHVNTCAMIRASFGARRGGRRRTRTRARIERARYPPLLPPVSSGHGYRERGATPPLVIPQCFPHFQMV